MAGSGKYATVILVDIVIVFASRSGNTRRAAEWLEELWSAEGLAVTLHDAVDFQPQVLDRFPVLVLGCSTIGDGDLLPAFFPWEKALRDRDLSAHWGAAFGTGARRYPHFATAVDILETRLRNSGVRLLQPGLKIDTTLGLRREMVMPWGQELCRRLQEEGLTSRL